MRSTPYLRNILSTRRIRVSVLAGFVGAVPAVLIGGIGSILVAGLWMVMFPSIRKLESLTKMEG